MAGVVRLSGVKRGGVGVVEFLGEFPSSVGADFGKDEAGGYAGDEIDDGDEEGEAVPARVVAVVDGHADDVQEDRDGVQD